ncbi:MAG: MCP four helix bundle domain-containing protein [Calditrichaceae bacterium]
MKIKNLKLSRKLFLGFGFVLIMMFGVNIFSIRQMNRLKLEIDNFNNQWLPSALAISSLNLNTADLRRSQLQYAFTLDDETKQELVTSMISTIDNINDNLDTYAKLKQQKGEIQELLEEEKDLFKGFETDWETYQDLSFTIFRLSREDKQKEAYDLLDGQTKVIYSSINDKLQKLLSFYKNEVIEGAKNADLVFQATKKLITSLVVITILLSIIFVLWLIRWIRHPIRQLEKGAKKVAGGDLSVQLDITSEDEIGNLTNSFNLMTKSLREAMEKSKVQADRLKMQWEVLNETYLELELKSDSLEKQKSTIEKKNRELRKTMEKLKSTQSQLIESEKMASLGQLTAGIAHEINNPINYISAGINPLKRDMMDIESLYLKYKEASNNGLDQNKLSDAIKFSDDIESDFLFEEIKSLLEGIEEGALRTREIVIGLRNFSRMDEDAIKVANVNEGIDSTLMLLRNKIKNKITINKEYGQIPPIDCYPGKLNQVFMNILNNATDAIKDVGEISIRTWGNDNHIFISIKDNGIGMPENVRKRIFEPFFTTKDVGQGTGLGLSISFGIIEKHKGTITVKSKKNEGSEFIIQLPINLS